MVKTITQQSTVYYIDNSEYLYRINFKDSVGWTVQRRLRKTEAGFMFWERCEELENWCKMDNGSWQPSSYCRPVISFENIRECEDLISIDSKLNKTKE